jgi:hypothetical protein
MFASITDGLTSAGKRPKLLLLLWGWYGLLALVPSLPAWAWWNGILGPSPESARVLKGFSFGVFGELVRRDSVSGLRLLMAATAVLLVVAWLSSAFVFGGILEVLGTEDDRRSFMHRFFRGGGHFFWRFVRLSLTAVLCVVLAAGIVSVLAALVSSPLANTEWEPAGYFAGLGSVLAVVLVSALFLLALDYARIRAARDDARGMLKAYAGGLSFVLRNLLTTYGVAILFVVLLAALTVGYVAYESQSPAAATWGAIGTLFLVQQAVVLGRVYLRVALVGAERQVDVVYRPVPIPAAVPGTESARVADPLPVLPPATAEKPADAPAEPDAPIATPE